MFILDSILLAPLHGMVWLARAVDDAAGDLRASRRRDAVQELQDLYRALQRGKITDDEFDAAEQILLKELEGQA